MRLDSHADDIDRLFTFVLIDGGPALLFWGLIVCGLGMTCVYASIAELASISPTAGGQYHWVSEFAPRKIQKFLSYSVGESYDGMLEKALTSFRLVDCDRLASLSWWHLFHGR